MSTITITGLVLTALLVIEFIALAPAMLKNAVNVKEYPEIKKDDLKKAA